MAAEERKTHTHWPPQDGPGLAATLIGASVANEISSFAPWNTHAKMTAEAGGLAARSGGHHVHNWSVLSL